MDLGIVLELFAVAINLYLVLLFSRSNKAVLLVEHVIFPDTFSC